MVIWRCTYNQNTQNLESSFNRLRIATLRQGRLSFSLASLVF
jgi:hypothetical protein